MKPGNLLIQGAKSGGERKMRIRYKHIGSFGVLFSLCNTVANSYQGIEREFLTDAN